MNDLPATPIFGNLAARRQLIQILREAKHHTLLLTGVEGLGKATLAKQLACWTFGGAQEEQAQFVINPHHFASRQMMNGSHPDFLYLNPENYSKKSRQIPTEALESLHLFAQRQGDSPRRIVVIDALDDCHPVLAQGLLKLLEEPPRKVLFLLINHRPGQVLDTLRSRAQVIKFHPLTATETENCLPHLPLGENPPESETLLALADGVPGRIATLATADLEGLLIKLTEHLQNRENNSEATHVMAEYVCHKKHNHLEAWRILCRWLVRAILRETISRSPTRKFPLAEPILRQFRDVPISQRMLDTLQMTQEITEKIQRAPTYLNPEQVVQYVLGTWYTLAHPKGTKYSHV